MGRVDIRMVLQGVLRASDVGSAQCWPTLRCWWSVLSPPDLSVIHINKLNVCGERRKEVANLI